MADDRRDHRVERFGRSVDARNCGGRLALSDGDGRYELGERGVGHPVVLMSPDRR